MSVTRVLAVDLGGVVFLPETDGDPWAALGERLGVPPALVRSALWHSEDVEAANVGRLSAEDYAARAAERRCQTLNGEEALRGELLAYLNRLSDLLFVAARLIARRQGVAEVLWQAAPKPGI